MNVIGGGPTLRPAAPIPHAVECDAEVGNFQRALDSDEEVFRLQISMRNLPVVAVSEALDEVHKKLARGVLLQRAALGPRNVVEELAAADKLDHMDGERRRGEWCGVMVRSGAIDGD